MALDTALSFVGSFALLLGDEDGSVGISTMDISELSNF